MSEVSQPGVRSIKRRLAPGSATVMRQQLHLLIVDREQRTALAARYGRRWLLPSIRCGETIRGAPLAARWCAERGLETDVAGQWLGRVDAGAIDWLMVIAARRGSPPSGTTLEWIPIDALAEEQSVLDYQTWAVARCVEGVSLPRVDGPFGSLDWPARVQAWLANVLEFGPCSCTSYRVSPFEVVAAFDTARARVYFKGLTGARMSEPTINDRLAAAAPDSFARKLALEHREDGTLWWVTAQCPGRPASDPDVVAAALARLQCHLRDDALGELPRLDPPVTPLAHLPESWIPMDLDPSNVLVDSGQVRFIDLDDSFIGPAPLAMAGFARRCGAAAAAYRAYERGWSPPLGALDWRHLENVAAAFQTSLGWKRVLMHIDRGELHADLDLLRNRIQARLARAIYRG